MPDEDLPADEAAETKPKRKPAAKKAPAKKAAVKKPAAKKAAPAAKKAAAVKKPAAKKAAAKRKTKAEAAAETTPELPLAEAPAPAPAPVVEVAPEPPAAVVIEAAPPPAPEPAPVVAAAEAPQQAPAAQPQQQQPQNAHERRKSKFERWKEKQRQRALERQQARLNGGQAGQGGQNGPQPSNNQGNAEPLPAKEIELGPPEPANGILELHPKGYGNLRQKDRAYAQHPNDCWVSQDLIRQYGMREGMLIAGVQRKGPRGPQLTEVSEINARAPEAVRDLPLFEELKAINPNKRIQLETNKDRLTTRVIDMFTPVGRGQRGLIVAPPRSGKTTILQHVAEAVTTNHPGTHLMILLVDERPEEVTEFKRALPNAEIFASSNDQDVKCHTRISQFAIERAKRLVECGEHVFMLIDSITRMARSFNNTSKNNATMSGGVGVGALEIPRRLFAAARNTRTAGSLTILATALIETGSKMDDLIFLEFKGTGNMELVLDRKIAEQFYYPAVNIFKSGTRREELLLQSFQLDKIHMLRRGLAGGKPIDAIQRVLTLLERYPSNAQMLVDLPSKTS
ncbi:MAG: transcription termination factor Rho [Verrucomicrobiaceae bacterium]